MRPGPRRARPGASARRATAWGLRTLPVGPPGTPARPTPKLSSSSPSIALALSQSIAFFSPGGEIQKNAACAARPVVSGAGQSACRFKIRLYGSSGRSGALSSGGGRSRRRDRVRPPSTGLSPSLCLRRRSTPQPSKRPPGAGRFAAVPRRPAPPPGREGSPGILAPVDGRRAAETGSCAPLALGQAALGARSIAAGDALDLCPRAGTALLLKVIPRRPRGREGGRGGAAWRWGLGDAHCACALEFGK